MNIVDNKSNQYNVRVYRKTETLTKEDVMAEFEFFLEHKCETLLKDEIEQVKKAITEFIGYDLEKVRAGEREMLARWSK